MYENSRDADRVKKFFVFKISWASLSHIFLKINMKLYDNFLTDYYL